MPSGNTTEVNDPRAALIWCFVNGRDFDLAKIIQEEMKMQCSMQRYGLFFTSLVTWLCSKARVPEYKDTDGKVKRKEILG